MSSVVLLPTHGSANCLICHSADTYNGHIHIKKGCTHHSIIHQRFKCSTEGEGQQCAPSFSFKRRGHHHQPSLISHQAATKQCNVSLTSSRQQPAWGSASSMPAASAAPVAVGVATEPTSPELLSAACQDRRKHRAPRTEIDMFVGEARRTSSCLFLAGAFARVFSWVHIVFR